MRKNEIFSASATLQHDFTLKTVANRPGVPIELIQWGDPISIYSTNRVVSPANARPGLSE